MRKFITSSSNVQRITTLSGDAWLYSVCLLHRGIDADLAKPASSILNVYIDSAYKVSHSPISREYDKMGNITCPVCIGVRFSIRAIPIS
ncbi:MAG: hypothetical protein ABFD54_13075 [Armatimonadota bacterium]